MSHEDKLGKEDLKVFLNKNELQQIKNGLHELFQHEDSDEQDRELYKKIMDKLDRHLHIYHLKKHHRNFVIRVESQIDKQKELDRIHDKLNALLVWGISIFLFIMVVFVTIIMRLQ